MINGLLGAFTGTSNIIVIGIFKALLTAVAAPLILFLVKSWHTEHLKRRERRRNLYADALAACMEYKEFPYVIYRRNGLKPEEERTRISEALREVQKRISHHQTWLATEAKEVSEAYDNLVKALRTAVGEEMKKRWKAKPIKNDAEMTVVPKFDWNAVTAEEKRYIKAVRRQLSSFWKIPFIR